MAVPLMWANPLSDWLHEDLGGALNLIGCCVLRNVLFLSGPPAGNRQVRVNLPHTFCYVCVQYVIKSQSCRLTRTTKQACYMYFGCDVGGQDKQ
ncbi:hypothetical protein PR048_016253 [Dryococelus australis]|uniref:Secreted protein n=1 Tax=Dryococelus australis TaxID=614101 RepID=A0ABQ9HJ80_9NEOP|nr:hypothetical protein PR048_016253 [Dryococelus australis]